MEDNEIEMSKDEKKPLKREEKKRLGINIVLCFVIMVVAILIANFHGFSFGQKQDNTVDFSGVNRICELSTLRCYYHNVAELEKEPDDGLFQYGWFHVGYKKLWLEYTGIIEVGIDASQVQVNQPDENNVVYVYVPDAEITEVRADSSSIGEPIMESGAFTKVTTEDQNQLFAQAQEEMKEEAQNDTAILNRAKNNAKKLIEQYIVNVGDQIGESYTVKWMDETIKGDVDG